MFSVVGYKPLNIQKAAGQRDLLNFGFGNFTFANLGFSSPMKSKHWEKTTCAKIFISALFIIANSCEPPKCLVIRESVSKLWIYLFIIN